MKQLIALAALSAAAATFPVGASAAASCYVNGQGKKEVNVATQFGTDDAAIRGALRVAEAGGCGVYLTSTTFTYSSILVDNGLDIYGDGATTVLEAVDPNNSAVYLRGTSPKIRGVKITAPAAATRGDDWANAGIFIDGATGFTVDHVTVDRVRGAGIFDFGGSYGSITSSTVRNVLADGIHNAHGAHDVDVAFNTVTNAGDDLIAVVSYTFDSGFSYNIQIHDNVVSTQPWGRGISVVGGRDILIERNQIDHTYGAGIYIASEPGGLPTRGVDGVIVNSNTIRVPDQGQIHGANVRVWGGNPGYVVANVSGSGNSYDTSKPGVRADGAIQNVTLR
ncbi:MAG: right-handed parallel beta-helix repeat-containing protein [Actinomycetota bacterium]